VGLFPVEEAGQLCTKGVRGFHRHGRTSLDIISSLTLAA
jgi:hypothetical protein